MKNIMIALAGALAVAGCSSSSSEPIGTPTAVLTVVFEGHPQDTMKVIVTDTATISAAEAYVATKQGSRLMIGRIVKGAGYDARYPFRYLPATVRLVDMAMEVCDGAPMRTTQDVNNFFEWSTGNANSAETTWCPWASEPIAVQRISAL